MTSARIRVGAVIAHDHRYFRWPDHSGAQGRDFACDVMFNAEPAHISGKMKLTAHGFGKPGAYGSGAIYADVKDIKPCP